MSFFKFLFGTTDAHITGYPVQRASTKHCQVTETEYSPPPLPGNGARLLPVIDRLCPHVVVAAKLVGLCAVEAVGVAPCFCQHPVRHKLTTVGISISKEPIKRSFQAVLCD